MCFLSSRLYGTWWCDIGGGCCEWRSMGYHRSAPVSSNYNQLLIPGRQWSHENATHKIHRLLAEEPSLNWYLSIYDVYRLLVSWPWLKPIWRGLRSAPSPVNRRCHPLCVVWCFASFVLIEWTHPNTKGLWTWKSYPGISRLIVWYQRSYLLWVYMHLKVWLHCPLTTNLLHNVNQSIKQSKIIKVNATKEMI